MSLGSGTSDPRNREGVADLAPEDFAGIPGSPPVLSHARTVRQLMPKKLTHRLKYVAQLAAMGLTQAEICDRTGYTPSRLSIVLNSPHVSNEVERTRRYVFEHDVERAQKTMLPKALESIHAVLNFETSNFKELKARSETGFALIERTHGKATQKIEASGNLLADLYAMLDAKAFAQGPGTGKDSSIQEAEVVSRDAPVEDTSDPFGINTSDPLDAFLNSSLPKEPLK